MLSISIEHPDALEFIESKQDLSKVTGANISVRVTDSFMEAVIKDDIFFQRWPTVENSNEVARVDSSKLELNKLIKTSLIGSGDTCYVRLVKARELWDKLIHCAWNTAEPGILFWNNITNNGPDAVYPEFKPVSTNPCGEIPMGPYDSCRLIHVNLASLVVNPYTESSYIDYVKAREVFYNVSKLADDLVDLEVEAIDHIIGKIFNKGYNTAEAEITLWNKIKNTTLKGRRCGIGITGLADMLAMLGVKYGSTGALNVVENLMSIKFETEVKAQVDLARDRGAFKECDVYKEFVINAESYTASSKPQKGKSPFFDFMSKHIDPTILSQWFMYGHRNISWSTVAPTGTISMLTQTTSGIEPLFMPYYQRSKKVQGDEEYDFMDATGEKFKNFIVVHKGLKDWASLHSMPVGTLEEIQKAYECSPYFLSTAEDIPYESRIAMQSVLQKYTTHAISSTVNLPNEATEELVSNLYMKAYQSGLKGITIYRDGCRTGILNKVSDKETEEFPQYDTPKRPKVLRAKVHLTKVKGQPFAIFVGLYCDKPYEVFAVTPVPPVLKECDGTITKVKKGHYRWVGDNMSSIDNIGLLNDELQAACTISTSLALRQGSKIPYVIKTLRKASSGVTSLAAAISRILAKYVPEDAYSNKEVCPNCGTGKIIHENGCVHCSNCEYSICNFVREL